MITDTTELAARLTDLCTTRDIRLATAESCTGGMVVAVLTEQSGSSAVVDAGIVTYSPEAKTALLGVPAKLIEKHGVVSREVAEAMAKGALERTKADIAISVTGIAGPGGGTAELPVGLSHLAVASRRGSAMHQRHVFGGDRSMVRGACVAQALLMLLEAVGEASRGPSHPA